MICDSIEEHFEHNNLINGNQHGFRRCRSCLSNLLFFLDKVTGMVDEDKDVDIIYFDFAKAFDKVPHQQLLIKLCEVRINGCFRKWISLWLNDRKNRVIIRGSYSNWKEVISGVPQGYVLGPILFLIVISNIDEGLFSHILKYADDTMIFNTVMNDADHKKLQDDLTSLETWSQKWQIEFNATKCPQTSGHSLKLRKQHCRTDLRKFFFSERVVSWQNLLDADAVSAATVNSFKNLLQQIRGSKRSFFTDT